MSLSALDGKVNSIDVRTDRIAAGTVGNVNIVPGSLSGAAINTVITPFDPRITYGGTWTLSGGLGFEDYLSQNATSNVTGSNLNVTFNGTSLSIVGSTVPGGGYADIYVDGVLQGGRINTYTFLSVAYYPAGLSASATTITANDTSAFAASGSILIDGEVITYSGKTATDFTGCTRGAGGSIAAVHSAASQIYAYSSLVNFYSPYKQSRITVWQNGTLANGPHTVQVVVRSDKDPAASDYFTYISGLILGGVVGASNVATNLDYFTTSKTFDANGLTTSGFAPTNAGVKAQILGILGASAFSGSTYKPCFVSWNPTNQSFYFYCPTGASSTLTVVCTLLVLGSST